MISGIDTLRSQILSRRRYGRTTCIIRDRGSGNELRGKAVTAEVDSFVNEEGFKGLGDDWAEISKDDAKVIAQTILQQDLAYKAPIMSEIESLGLADSFFSLFGQDVRCFTNGNLIVDTANPKWVPGAFSTISKATFDSGVVCVDADRIGMLWVEDED